MLRLAWLFFIAWIVLMLIAPTLHGFAGPLFWSSQIALLAGVIAWAIHYKRKGYSSGEIVLLCLFVILAVGGIGTCLAVEGYKGNQSSRAHRTQADIRMIATAWEERASRLNQYNAAGEEITIPALTSGSGLEGNPNAFTLRYTLGPDALAQVLEPTYVKVLPRIDGWGNAWRFATDEPFLRGNGAPAQIYLIQSAGANGRFDPIVRGHVVNYDCDIIYSNGAFMSW